MYKLFSRNYLSFVFLQSRSFGSKYRKNVDTCTNFIKKTILQPYLNGKQRKFGRIRFVDLETFDEHVKCQLIAKGHFGFLNSPKNQLENFDLAYWGRKFLFIFLEELKTPEGHFEIY